MPAQDSYSSSDVVAILHELGVEEVNVAEESADLHSSLTAIDCKQGNLEFRCYLMGSEPLYMGMYLSASIFFVSPNPHEFANLLNSKLSSATFHVSLDDNNEAVPDEEGDYLMIANAEIMFDGGVTAEHIGRRISVWIEDLVESFDLDESTLEDSQIAGVIESEVKEMGTAEQIKWVLEVDSIPRTARQLAAFLMKKKPEVNSVLYRRSDLFCHDKAQPPRWSLSLPSE